MSSDAEPRQRQPYLHELITAVHAPSLALSARDGQIRPDGGVAGFYCSDRRLLSGLMVTVDGSEPVAIQTLVDAADRVRFVGTLRNLGDRGADPTVFLERTHAVGGDSGSEIIEILNCARAPINATLHVHVESDLAEMPAVKSGRTAPSLSATATDRGLAWRADDGTTVTVTAQPPPTLVASESGGLSWTVALQCGERFRATLAVGVSDDPNPRVVRPVDGSLAPLTVHSGDDRLGALIERSIADATALLLADPLEPRDHFLAAGAPWFLTLFGRDSLWAARMLLPLGTELAAGTLRALARRQGTQVDGDTAEEPGKIMHEIRRAPARHGRWGGTTMDLPPLYYGTVDATPLWVLLLHDSWRWGLAESEVRSLLPAAERAMDWLADYGLGDSGFISYRDRSGHGLANQGWKDSADAVQFRDGSLAKPPIALCEVQGYAYAAALDAAALFDAFGRPGGGEWRDWAAGLADRFRATFWVDDADGAFPAIALDATGQPVDTVTSNIGHLLGTGLLDEREERLVIARLSDERMDSGYGLRTLSADSTGFNPLAYHGGSVWTHDTAIAIGGLVATGGAGDAAAASLIDGLLAAAPAFDYRLPELFGGHARTHVPAPIPYPASCRPQAWSAAAALALVTSLLGIVPDVPAGTVRMAPLHPSPVGALSVRGLRIGSNLVDVEVSADGRVAVSGLPDGLRLNTGPAISGPAPG